MARRRRIKRGRRNGSVEPGEASTSEPSSDPKNESRSKSDLEQNSEQIHTIKDNVSKSNLENIKEITEVNNLSMSDQCGEEGIQEKESARKGQNTEMDVETNIFDNETSKSGFTETNATSPDEFNSNLNNELSNEQDTAAKNKTIRVTRNNANNNANKEISNKESNKPARRSSSRKSKLSLNSSIEVNDLDKKPEIITNEDLEKNVEKNIKDIIEVNKSPNNDESRDDGLQECCVSSGTEHNTETDAEKQTLDSNKLINMNNLEPINGLVSGTNVFHKETSESRIIEINTVSITDTNSHLSNNLNVPDNEAKDETIRETRNKTTNEANAKAINKANNENSYKASNKPARRSSRKSLLSLNSSIVDNDLNLDKKTKIINEDLEKNVDDDIKDNAEVNNSLGNDEHREDGLQECCVFSGTEHNAETDAEKQTLDSNKLITMNNSETSIKSVFETSELRFIETITVSTTETNSHLSNDLNVPDKKAKDETPREIINIANNKANNEKSNNASNTPARRSSRKPKLDNEAKDDKTNKTNNNATIAETDEIINKVSNEPARRSSSRKGNLSLNSSQEDVNNLDLDKKSKSFTKRDLEPNKEENINVNTEANNIPGSDQNGEESCEIDAGKQTIVTNVSITINNSELDSIQSISKMNISNNETNESRLIEIDTVSTNETNSDLSNDLNIVLDNEATNESIQETSKETTNEADTETSNETSNEPSRRSGRKRKLSWKIVEAAKKPRKFSKYEVTTTRLLAAASGVYCEQATNSFDQNDKTLQVHPESFVEDENKTSGENDQEDDDNIVCLESGASEINPSANGMKECQDQEIRVITNNAEEVNIIRKQMQRRKLSLGLQKNTIDDNVTPQNGTTSEAQTKDNLSNLEDENMIRIYDNDVNEDVQVVKNSTPVKSIRRCGGRIIKKLTEEELNLKKFLKRDTPADNNSDALTPPPSPSSINMPVIHGNLPETAVVVGFIRNKKMHFLVTNRPLGEKQIRDGNLKGKMRKIANDKLKNKETKKVKNVAKIPKRVSGIENDDPEKNKETEKVAKTSRLGRKIQPSVRLQDLGSWENKNKKLGNKVAPEKYQEEEKFLKIEKGKGNINFERVKTEKVLKTSRLGRKVLPSVRLQDLGSTQNKNKKTDTKVTHSPKKKKLPLSVKKELDKIVKNNSESPYGRRGALKPRTSFKVRKILKSYNYQQSKQKFTYEQSHASYPSPKKIDINSLLAKAPSKSILKNSLKSGYPPREFDRTIVEAVPLEANNSEAEEHSSGFQLNIASLIKSPTKCNKSKQYKDSKHSANLNALAVKGNINFERVVELTSDIDHQIFSNLPSSLDNILPISLSKTPEHVQDMCDQLDTGGNHLSDDDEDDRHDPMDVVSPEHIQELSSISPEDVADTLGVTSGEVFQDSQEGMLSSELFSEPLDMPASPSRFDPEPLTPPESSGESSPPCGGETSGEEPLFGPLKMDMANGKISIDCLETPQCEDSTASDTLDNNATTLKDSSRITNGVLDEAGPILAEAGEWTDPIPSSSSSCTNEETSCGENSKTVAPNWFLLPPSKNFLPDPTMLASMLPTSYGPPIRVDNWPTTPHLDIAENVPSGKGNEVEGQQPDNGNLEPIAYSGKHEDIAPKDVTLVKSALVTTTISTSMPQQEEEGGGPQPPKKRKSVTWLDLQAGACVPPRQRRKSSSGREIMSRDCDCCGDKELNDRFEKKHTPGAPLQHGKEGASQIKIKNEPYIIVHRRFEREQWEPNLKGNIRKKAGRPRPSNGKFYEKKCKKSRNTKFKNEEFENELSSDTEKAGTEERVTSTGRTVKKKKKCTCPDCTIVKKVVDKSKINNHTDLQSERKLLKKSRQNSESNDVRGSIEAKKAAAYKESFRSPKEKKLSREAALQKLKRALSRKPLWERKAEEVFGISFDKTNPEEKRRGRPPGSGKRGPGRPAGSSKKMDVLDLVGKKVLTDEEYSDFTDAGEISDSEADHTFSVGEFDESESDDYEGDSLSSTIKRVKSSLSSSQVNVKMKVSSSSNHFLSKKIRLGATEGPHKCIYCSKGFRSLTGLQNHVYTHTGEKPFRCTECDFCATRKSVLVQHLRGVHSEDKPYACTMCDFKCNQSGTLARHTLTHTDERQYSCPYCPNRFNLKAHLKQHLLTHTGVTPYSCPYCDSTFKSLSNMKAHTRTHTGEKPYSCPLCDYRSAQKSHLNRHMVTHTQEKPFLCGDCGYRCSLKHQLKSHFLNNHTDEANFACDQCNYKAKSQTLLKDHKMFHTGDYPFECFDCDYRCSKASVYKKHLLIHGDENPYVCPECGYGFKRKDNLKNHMKTHGIDESDTGHFKCPECAASFSQKVRLTRHLKVHQPQIPHKCDECGQCYIKIRELKQHKLKHKIQRATENFPRPEDSPGRILASMSPASYMTLPEEGGSVRIPPSPAVSYMTSPEYEQYELDDETNIRHDFPTGEYPYECSQCYFGCDNEGDLMTHMQEHIDMYECAECEYCCSTQEELQLHSNECHSFSEFYTLQSPGHNDGITLHPLLPVFPGEGILLDL